MTPDPFGRPRHDVRPGAVVRRTRRSSAGVAILRGRSLPGWLGWAVIVIGFLFVTPAEFAAFILLLVWIVVLTVMMLRRA